jgi:hypothetical protein
MTSIFHELELIEEKYYQEDGDYISRYRSEGGEIHDDSEVYDIINELLDFMKSTGVQFTMRTIGGKHHPSNWKVISISWIENNEQLKMFTISLEK